MSLIKDVSNRSHMCMWQADYLVPSIYNSLDPAVGMWDLLRSLWFFPTTCKNHFQIWRWATLLHTAMLLMATEPLFMYTIWLSLFLGCRNTPELSPTYIIFLAACYLSLPFLYTWYINLLLLCSFLMWEGKSLNTVESTDSIVPWEQTHTGISTSNTQINTVCTDNNHQWPYPYG